MRSILVTCVLVSSFAGSSGLTLAESADQQSGADQPAAQKKPDAAERKPVELPWKLDRPIAYSWFTEKTKTGSILVTIKKIDDPAGAFYRMTSHRRQSHEGRGSRCTAELDFTPKLRPIRYKEDANITTGVRGGTRQDWRISFRGAKVKSTCINNGQSDKATTVETEVAPDTYLFATGALEQWSIFALQLDREKPTRIRVFYPLFGRTVKLDFTPQKKEELEIGGKKVPALRYAFRYPEFGESGSIWLDARNRLLKYSSSSLTLLVDGV